MKTKSDDYKKIADDPPPSTSEKKEISTPSRRELLKNRAPPAGYQMGPAVINIQERNPDGGRGYSVQDGSNHSIPGARGYHHGGRGRGRFQRLPVGPSDQGRGLNTGPPARAFVGQVRFCF
jgi:hypothetical protein